MDYPATINLQKTPANAIFRTLSRPYSMRKSPQSQSGTFLARERNLCVRERYLHVASLFNVVCSISMLHIFDSLRSSIFGVKSTKIALVGTIALTMGPYIFGRPYSTLIAKKPSDAFLAFRVPYPPLQFNVENKKLYFDAPIVSI